jgi:alpha-tubulin suppressor-like RCC1 family protein
MSCRDWIRSWLKFFPLFFFPALCCAQNIGSVRGWGDNTGNKLNIPLDLTNAVAIAAGNLHSLAVRATGSVVGWGDNSDGQATPPSNLNDAVAVAAGSAHSVALRRNGTVIAWGANAANQTNVPVGLTGVRAIACGENFSVALQSNGTLSRGATLRWAKLPCHRATRSRDRVRPESRAGVAH